jgi:hypothetical protein
MDGDEEFISLVNHDWKMYDPLNENRSIFQFTKSLKKFNKVIGDWEKLHFQNS